MERYMKDFENFSKDYLEKPIVKYIYNQPTVYVSPDKNNVLVYKYDLFNNLKQIYKSSII